MENTIIKMPIALNANGGLNPEVVAKNISAMYGDTLLLARQELTAAVCKLYDLGMTYPDFVDSESLSSFFGGLSYFSVSGSGKKYDFIDGEHANIEVLVDVFTDPTYVEPEEVLGLKTNIINAVKAAVIDYLKNQGFGDELAAGVNLILHEVIPTDIIPELLNTDTTPGAEFRKNRKEEVVPQTRDFYQENAVSDSGYPVLDLINEYVAGVSGRGNDLFNNPDPGLKEKPVTEREFDSIIKLTTPKVENIKMNWSGQSKSSDTIKNRADAEKLLKLQ